MTDFGDFLFLQSNFGQSAGFNSVALTAHQVAAVAAFDADPATRAVPEPTLLAVTGLSVAATASRRRQTH